MFPFDGLGNCSSERLICPSHTASKLPISWTPKFLLYISSGVFFFACSRNLFRIPRYIKEAEGSVPFSLEEQGSGTTGLASAQCGSRSPVEFLRMKTDPGHEDRSGHLPAALHREVLCLDSRHEVQVCFRGEGLTPFPGWSACSGLHTRGRYRVVISIHSVSFVNLEPDAFRD